MERLPLQEVRTLLGVPAWHLLFEGRGVLDVQWN
jgi:hypothetical protein